MSDTLIRTAGGTWKPGSVPGVSVQVLRRDKATGESTSLVRFAPGTKFPAHNHPAGEEIFVLEGDFTVGAHRLTSESISGAESPNTPPLSTLVRFLPTDCHWVS